MPKTKKYRPIHPLDKDIAFFHEKLRRLVKRLRYDYNRLLKPLVLKMSEKARKAAVEENENAKALLSAMKQDSVVYLTDKEVATRLGILKRQVREDAKKGLIEGAMWQGDRLLVPEESVRAYGIAIGKIEPEDELVNLFNSRLEELMKKYRDLTDTFTKLAKLVVKKSYQSSAKSFVSQIGPIEGIDILKVIHNERMGAELRQRMDDCVNLISSIPQQYFTAIRKGVFGSISGSGWNYRGGLQQYIVDLTHITYERAKLIARDQTMKAVSSFTQIRMENCGIEYYIWRNSRDRRTSGNPNGLYPRDSRKRLQYKLNPQDKRYYYEGHPGTDLSKAHGNHWDREGKVFSWNTPPPDGHPGMGIQCRCYAEPYFPDLGVPGLPKTKEHKK